MKRILLAIGIAVVFTASASAMPIFEGMLSTPDGVEASGVWANNFKISWRIEQQAQDNSWFYKYWLTELNGDPLEPGAVSHFTLEVSPNVTENDFWGYNGNPVELGTWDESSFIENSMKLDYGGEGQTEWSFYSWRAPTWGDFYAKDGEAGGLGLNAAWNAGYLLDDPVSEPTNGTIDYKILRPDTQTVIPEPTTLGLLGIGLAGVALRVRKRKKIA